MCFSNVDQYVQYWVLEESWDLNMLFHWSPSKQLMLRHFGDTLNTFLLLNIARGSGQKQICPEWCSDIPRLFSRIVSQSPNSLCCVVLTYYTYYILTFLSSIFMAQIVAFTLSLAIMWSGKICRKSQIMISRWSQTGHIIFLFSYYFCNPSTGYIFGNNWTISMGSVVKCSFLNDANNQKN